MYTHTVMTMWTQLYYIECCTQLVVQNVHTIFHLSLQASAILSSPCSGNGKLLTELLVPSLLPTLTSVASHTTCSLPFGLLKETGYRPQVALTPNSRGESSIFCTVQCDWTPATTSIPSATPLASASFPTAWWAPTEAAAAAAQCAGALGIHCWATSVDKVSPESEATTSCNACQSLARSDVAGGISLPVVMESVQPASNRFVISDWSMSLFPTSGDVIDSNRIEFRKSSYMRGQAKCSNNYKATLVH